MNTYPYQCIYSLFFEGHCHCEAGYAPPFCDAPGSGGSLDSGPASDIEAKTSGWLILLYLLLMFVPIVIVIWFLSHRVPRSDWRLLVDKASKPRKRSEIQLIKIPSVKIYALKLVDSKLLNSKQSVIRKLFHDEHFTNLQDHPT